MPNKQPHLVYCSSCCIASSIATVHWPLLFNNVKRTTNITSADEETQLQIYQSSTSRKADFFGTPGKDGYKIRRTFVCSLAILRLKDFTDVDAVPFVRALTNSTRQLKLNSNDFFPLDAGPGWGTTREIFPEVKTNEIEYIYRLATTRKRGYTLLFPHIPSSFHVLDVVPLLLGWRPNLIQFRPEGEALSLSSQETIRVLASSIFLSGVNSEASDELSASPNTSVFQGRMTKRLRGLWCPSSKFFIRRISFTLTPYLVFDPCPRASDNWKSNIFSASKPGLGWITKNLHFEKMSPEVKKIEAQRE